jgi:colanic acid/amylovoran biosynthesis glycosyltransferase
MLTDRSDMKIAYFINQYPKVSHSFIRREILALERLGVPVSRYALRGWNAELVDSEDIVEQSKTRYVLESGIPGLLGPVLRCLFSRPVSFLRASIQAFRLGLKSDRSLPYHFIYLAEACWLIKSFSREGITHVHAHFGTNSTEVVMLSRLLGGPSYSFTVHGPEEFDKPKFLHLEEKITHAAFVVGISSFGKSQLFRQVGHEQWSKVKIVHCGLESKFYDYEASPAYDSKQLVCVGRLCEQKGQLLLVEAARILRDRGQDFELVLAGDGELREEIEFLIDKYGLQKLVKITGWISSNQVREYMLSSRALVLASFAEGLPVVIMEAMSLKVPVLTTYIAGIPELVIPDVTGWLIPAGSVDALVEAMMQCLDASQEKLQGMGAVGKERVIDRHNIDDQAALLLANIQEAVSLEV